MKYLLACLLLLLSVTAKAETDKEKAVNTTKIVVQKYVGLEYNSINITKCSQEVYTEVYKVLTPVVSGPRPGFPYHRDKLILKSMVFLLPDRFNKISNGYSLLAWMYPWSNTWDVVPYFAVP